MDEFLQRSVRRRQVLGGPVGTGKQPHPAGRRVRGALESRNQADYRVSRSPSFTSTARLKRIGKSLVHPIDQVRQGSN